MTRFNSWGSYLITRRSCRACSRAKVPIRETHIGDLCFVCWVGAKICPKCNYRIMGGSCDTCDLTEERQNQVLVRSVSVTATDFSHSDARASEPKPRKAKGETFRHIVRTVTPPTKNNASKNKKQRTVKKRTAEKNVE